MRSSTKSQAAALPAETQSNNMARIWRAKLQKLCSMRWGNHNLPDNDDGRAILTAFLCFGLTDESASQDAFWSMPELPTLKHKARRMRWRDVGELIGLTFDEWRTAKLWIMRPVDKSEAELDAWRKEQRKTRDNARKRRLRSEQEQVRSANSRCDALLRILLRGDKLFPDNRPGAVYPPRYHSGGWNTLSSLVDLAVKCRAFRRPDGRALRKPRNAVRSTIKQLEAYGQIETKLQPGPCGMVMMVRKADLESGKADTFPGRPAALSALPAKAEKTGAFDCETALSAGKVDTAVMAHDDPLPYLHNVVPLKRREVA